MNRYDKVKEIQRLCADVHEDGGWCAVPWSPNRQVVCLEAIDGDEALFSLYADYVECANTVTGTFQLPLDECTFEKLLEETEIGIGFGLAERTRLTKISERPTSFDLHMTPTTPGAQGPSGGGALPVDRGIPVEALGSTDGMADAGTDRTFHAGGFHSLPTGPMKDGANVHEYHLPGRAPIDGKESTVDHVGTAMPGGTRRQPIGTPEYNEANEILPDKEMSRTNVHSVAVPEWSSAGQIDPNQVTKYAQSDRTSESAIWLQAWETTLEDHHPASTTHDVAPEYRRREEMGRKDFRHAIAVIVKDGSKVLLGKAQASDDRDGYWCFPGGGIDSGDGSDPVAAAIREAFEETGLQVTSKGVILEHPDKPTCAFVVCEFADRQDRMPEPNEEFTEFAWLDYDIRSETPMKIYPPNRSILERIPRDALYNSKTGRNLFHVKEGTLSEDVALRRQKPNKRAWAVSSNSRRITTGVNSEPHRRSKTGSSDKTKDRPSDKSVAATQNIKGKKALSSPSAPQDSAEKLHFQGGAKNPRKAAQDRKQEMDRIKQGRDPSALKPGDAGTPGKSDAEKEGKAAGGSKPAGGAKPPGGAQKPQAGPSMPSPQQAAAMPINDLVQAAQAVLAAAGMASGAGPAASAAAGPPAPATAGKQAPKPAGKNPAQATADKSPASKEKKDKQTQVQSPGASTPTEPKQQPQQPGQASPPGQMPQPQQSQGPQQGQQPGQSAGAGGINQQPPQPGMQPQQQQAPQQPGMQQAGQMQPQSIQPTQGMPPGQPGINGDMTAPGMQPQGMPAFQARVVDLVLRDRGNAEKCFRWLQALGFQPATPDHTTVQVIANNHEEMFLIQRTAKVFGLELAGLIPR